MSARGWATLVTSSGLAPRLPLVGLLVVFHHPVIPMHVHVHGDEAHGDANDMAKHAPRKPTVCYKHDVASGSAVAFHLSIRRLKGTPYFLSLF